MRVPRLLVLLVLPAAFAGGYLNGRLSQVPHPPRPAPPVPTTMPASAAAPAAVEHDIAEDMGYDLQAQVLDVDPLTRAVLASSPDEVQARLAYLELAWVPARASQLAASYAATIASIAANPSQPSMTAASFVVVRWSSVAVQGASAQATFTGHYVITEPRGPGAIVEADRTWAVHAVYLGGRWRMADRGLA